MELLNCMLTRGMGCLAALEVRQHCRYCRIWDRLCTYHFCIFGSPLSDVFSLFLSTSKIFWRRNKLFSPKNPHIQESRFDPQYVSSPPHRLVVEQPRVCTSVYIHHSEDPAHTPSDWFSHARRCRSPVRFQIYVLCLAIG